MDRPRMPRSVWMLGFVSLLMDVSSEMIHSLLPLFMVGALGASALDVGIIEGMAQATALITKTFAGVLSDYLGKRKALAVLGYGLGALCKPLFALAGSTGMVLGVRLLDRAAKGIRGAPRDALLADITPPGLRGAAFGLRQSLDTAGAFLGPLTGAALLYWWTSDLRAVFWVAVLPALLAALLLAFTVPEAPPAAPAAGAALFTRERLAELPRAFWWVVGAGAIFTLARFSDAFLVLRAQNAGVPTAIVPLVMVLMNVVYAGTAYPFGRLSDQTDPRRLLAISLVVLLAADVLLAWATSWPLLLAGVALWGVHMGMSQGLLSALVAAHAPPALRGTAFGIFNLACGLALLAASSLAGLLWEKAGPAATFVGGAVLCVLALASMFSVRQR
ncbi:MFS transporter [Massilia sp. TS11]|uniref:MFS transporter n=1 Tax=Massilia sp. TS11 TaxID=2908003 RepID=UPI001EDBDB07|nr:MFS transporter [Massilia sp. TS11]MCG2585622.1 MFS transporter [Massilia sp. TS11]